MTYTLTAVTEGEMTQLGKGLALELPPGSVVALYGTLGVGKTAFVRGLAAGLGYTGYVTSPTFALVNDYRERGKTVLFHFDMYRLDCDSLLDIGWDDYLAKGRPIAAEWADQVEELLPENTVRLYLSGSGEEMRRIRVESPFAVKAFENREVTQ